MRRAALAAYLILCLAAASCPSTRPPLPAVPVAELARPAKPIAEAPALTQDETDAAHLRGMLAEKDARIAAEHAAADRARQDGIRRVVDWACAVAALVGILGVGAAVMLKSATLGLVPIAATAMVAMGQTTNIIIGHPWLTAGGLAVLVALLAGVPALRRRAEQVAKDAAAKLP